jgi:secreted trypsin-like serine protease
MTRFVVVLLGVVLLLGGHATDAADDPASFTAVFNARCRATVIGTDTVLTAAHCVDLAPEQAIRLTINGETISAVCTPHPGFNDLTKANDIALCKLARAAPVSPFESIADETQAHLVRTGAVVRIAAGVASVERVQPADGALRVAGADKPGGFAVAQPGDSGGAAYVGHEAARVIVGVSSCGGTGCYDVKDPRTTVLANLTYQDTARFVRNWIREKDAHVCGINSREGCRKR